MYESATRLPHILPAQAYHDCAYLDQELACVFDSSWRLVADKAELKNHGDFVTCTLGRTPVQVRNFKGEIKAYSNVCAHRHCLLTDRAHGRSEQMRCQYHGWEYGPDGVTRRIPGAENFNPTSKGEFRLDCFPVETCGDLVFVRLSKVGPPLREFLGPLFSVCLERFASPWTCTLRWAPTYPCNWKIPVENSLESYHVPSVHSATFGADPGTDRSRHELGSHWTAFETTLPFNASSTRDEWFQKAEDLMVQWMGAPTSRKYRQCHVMPNLLFAFTDAIALVQVIEPVAPNRCRAVVRQFSIARPGVVGILGAAWGGLKSLITRRILIEDMGLFASIQKGFEGSGQKGVLGRCEERLHRFQMYMAEKVSGSKATDAAYGPK